MLTGRWMVTQAAAAASCLLFSTSANWSPWAGPVDRVCAAGTFLMTLSDQLYGCWDVVVLTDLSRSLSSSFGARGDCRMFISRCLGGWDFTGSFVLQVSAFWWAACWVVMGRPNSSVVARCPVLVLCYVRPADLCSKLLSSHTDTEADGCLPLFSAGWCL